MAAVECDLCRAIFAQTGRKHCPIHEDTASLHSPEIVPQALPAETSQTETVLAGSGTDAETELRSIWNDRGYPKEYQDTILDAALEKAHAEPAAELRALWDEQGVPRARQDAILADTLKQAQDVTRLFPR
ncbi:MAG: hypothetical protein FWD64_05520 [Acidobacteriaceae bacterium]|nr:hypothetical protein [Acidobacteriaceae bacterium]